MRFPVVAAAALALASGSTAALAQSFNAQAVRTANFLDSIGVNIHLESESDTAYSDQGNGGTAHYGTDPALGAVIVNGRTYTNVSKIVAALRYSGIVHARILLPADYVADRLQAIVQSVPALKIDLLTSTFDTVWNQVVNRAGLFVNQVEAFEGLNEATYSASFQGLTGSAADCRFQSTVWGTAQAYNSRHGTNVPVLAPSFTGNFADFGLLSVCSWASQAGNGHLYTQSLPPTFKSNYDLPYVRQDTPPGAPVWATEAGMATNPAATYGMSEDVAAKRTISALLSFFNSHVVRTYLYEAVDENPHTPRLNDNGNSDEMEMHFGLFHNDWTPKASAQMLHAQSVLLSDAGAAAWTFTPSTLSYTVSGAPPATYSTLMQKSTGSFVLAIWPEPSNLWTLATSTTWGYAQTIPTSAVTVSFGRGFSTIQVVDTFAPASNFTTGGSSVSVGLSDHPIYLMLQP